MAVLSKRGKQHQVRGDAVKARIIDASRALLEQGGSYAELSVDRIASEASVSRTTFYAHFQDKRELLLRLADDAARPMLERADQLIGGLPSGPDAARESVAMCVRLARENAVLYRAVFEASTYDKEVAAMWSALMDRINKAIARRFADEQAKGHLLTADPYATASVLTSMVAHACYRQVSEQSPLTDGQLLDTLQTIWVRATYGK